MTRIQVASLALAALAAAWSGTTSAVSVMFRGNSALAEMSPADLDALEEAARRALNEAADGEPVTWSNPETGSTGSVTPLHAEREDAGVCRDLEIVHTVSGKHGRARLTLCKLGYGDWKIVQPEQR
jgi:surface antigen